MQESDPSLGVVVVEDNDLIRALEVDILSGLGFDVRSTTTAEEGLRLLEEQSTALLITDIHLSGPLDGIALARAVRKRRPDLKIMLVGADVDRLAPEDLRFVADYGLRKPFTVNEFAEQLTKFARQHNNAPA